MLRVLEWTSPCLRGTSSTAPECRTFWAVRKCRETCRRRDGPGSVDAPSTPFRLARCRRCQVLFALCRHCDRGQVYCGPGCSVPARTECLRRARRRHRQSPEGRLDHRDRERERRRRRRLEAARVGDHPSAPPSPSVTVESPPENAGLHGFIPAPAPAPFVAPRPLRCGRCGSAARSFDLDPCRSRTRAGPLPR